MDNQNFDLEDAERKAIRPDLPGLRAQEGIDSDNAGSDGGGETNAAKANKGYSANNSQGDHGSDSASAVDSNGLQQAESQKESPWDTSSLAAASMGPGGAAALGANKLKNMFFGSSSRKRKSIGGGIIVLVLGGGVIGFSTLTGGAELIQLSHILQRNWGNEQNVTSSRANLLYRYSTAADANETNIGLLGRSILRPAVEDLKDIGVEFDVGGSVGLNGTTIDTEKLAAQYPELKDKSGSEREAFLDQKIPVAAGQFKAAGGGEITDDTTKFTVDSSNFSLASDKLLGKSAFGLLDDGKILTGINSRVFNRYLGVSSIFHPISRSLDEKYKQATTAAKEKQAVEQDEDAADAPVESQAGDAEADLVGSENSEVAKGALRSLAVFGGVCFVRGVSGDIVKVNRYLVVLPAVVEALRFVAIGEQIESGQDISASQINATESSLTDSQGNTIWNSAALQATEGTTNPSGPDLNTDYKQAFTDAGLAAVIAFYANKVLGAFPGGPSVACGPIGTALSYTLGGLESILSVVADVGSFGALTPATVGLWAAQEGSQFAETAVAMHFIQGFVLDKGTDGKLAQDAFSGPLGGNLLSYGAREASNESGVAAGLLPLAGTAASTLSYQQEQQSQKQFADESFFSRMFNIDDSRTLLGKLADSFSPGILNNVASVSRSFADMGGSAISDVSSLFSAKTSADTNYDWGFSQVGIPSSMLNNPKYANPYANADVVAGILNSPSSGCLNSDGTTNTSCALITKANTCFGDNIEKDTNNSANPVWNVVKDHIVDTNSDAYIAANCGQIQNDSTWQRVTMFVVDTTTMQGMACYNGDDQACQDVGEEASTETSAPTTPTSPATPTTGCSSTSGTTPTKSSSYFTVSGSTVCESNGSQYTPYGISINDDLVGPINPDPAIETQYQEATDAQIQAAAEYWHSNTIRIQVSETDILGTSTSASSYDATNMQRLGDQVNEIEQLGKIPVISDNTQQTDRPETAPTQKTIAFWGAVTQYLSSQSATKYNNVILDIFNEPMDETWAVWKNGGTGNNGLQSVGMQALVNSIRSLPNSMSNNLIWAEGPYIAGTLDQLDQYQLSGTNIEYSYHHVPFDNGTTNYEGMNDTWQGDIGLNLKIQVPVVDGEWAQYAVARGECFPDAPKYVDSYLSTLKANNIGLILWSLEPGVETVNSDPPGGITDKVASNFPITASGYSQPDSFASNYQCTGGYGDSSDPNKAGPLLGQGAGSIVMQYFETNDPGN
jgi:hypothetical protein